METLKEMDQETFKGIYDNERLRNEVAFAHGCCNAMGEVEYKKALVYPLSYKVTDEQIKIASELRNKRQKEVLIEHKNSLLFCAMGMSFSPSLKDGVGNHRIRTEFLNSDGVRCFIEFGTGREKEELRVDHAIFRYGDRKTEINNYQDLERSTPTLKYTFENVLNLVNKYFNCYFKKIIVDEYNISCDAVLCESPKVKI